MSLITACPPFWFLGQVYGAAEALFAQLAEELKRWADWVVLGTIQDLDEYADSNLTEVGAPYMPCARATALDPRIWRRYVDGKGQCLVRAAMWICLLRSRKCLHRVSYGASDETVSAAL